MTAVTSPKGELVEIVNERDFRELLGARDERPAGYTLLSKLDEIRGAIVTDLWHRGAIDDKSGRAVIKLHGRLCERLPDLNAKTLTMRLASPALAVCVDRHCRGKRTLHVGLQALPERWWDELALDRRPLDVEPERELVELVETHETEIVTPEIVTPPAVLEDLLPAELQVASAVAGALLTQVVEIIVAGNGGTQIMARLRSDIAELEARLGQQVGYVDKLRKDLRQAQDMVSALTVERDGLRGRVRQAEHNLAVATSASTQRLVDAEVHRQVDRLMRAVPGDVHARQ